MIHSWLKKEKKKRETARTPKQCFLKFVLQGNFATCGMQLFLILAVHCVRMVIRQIMENHKPEYHCIWKIWFPNVIWGLLNAYFPKHFNSGGSFMQINQTSHPWFLLINFPLFSQFLPKTLPANTIPLFPKSPPDHSYSSWSQSPLTPLC